MEAFNAETIHITWQVTVKLFSIWWPVLVGIGIVGVYTHLNERRVEREFKQTVVKKRNQKTKEVR